MLRPKPIEQMVKEFKSHHTTSHLLKIDNFSLLTKYQIKMVESSVFELGGHKWKLFVCPNGYKEENGHVSIFLENQDSINIKLQYQVFVISQLERKWQSSAKEDFSTSSISQKRGVLDLILLDDLEKKGCLIGDCCIFGVKLFGIKHAKPGTAECFTLIEKPLNHKVTWMMTRFSSFEPKKFHCSHEFVVGNRKWRIEIHPRGFKGEKDKSFSVYLSGEGFINNAPKTKTIAKFKLRVLDQVKQNHVEKTSLDWFGAEPNDHHGFADFMPLEKLNEPYLVNDKLYVGVDFEVISMTNYY